MTKQTLREVNAPYTVDPDDESVGRETIIIRRNGEPVAAVVPYAEYQEWLALKAPLSAPSRPPSDPQFEKQYAAFQRLLPELLKEHRGEWVGVVNEQASVFGQTSSAVLVEICKRFGDVPMCIQQVREQPRIYRMGGPRVVRSSDVRKPVVIVEKGRTENQSDAPE